MTGFEPLALGLGKVVLDIITDKSKTEGGNVLVNLLKRDIGQDWEALIHKVTRRYVESYTERHGTLKVLGMREPVKLDDVFTTVQFLSEYEVKRFVRVEDLERLYRESGYRLRYNRDERQDGIAVASEKQFLMVLGQPGAGKSTFLRKIGLEFLKGKKGSLKHDYIPVLLELKRLTKSEIDLKVLIANEFETCGFPKANEFTQSALEQGKLLILLDGLDEVPSTNINPVIDAIQDFVDRYDKNRYIASCRTAAYRYNFKRFSDVILSDFSDEQIHQFINNWFRSEEDKQSGTATQCWELLNKGDNRAAKELAHTPLLLTFLCLVYDKSQTFSNNRSGLYKKALRILLEEWAAEKRILRREVYEGLSIELEEVLLSEIAYAGFAADRLFMSQSQLVEQIKGFLSSNLNAPKHLDGEAVLDAIAIQQGIWVERTEAVYSFSHLSLQEYLTARYICVHGQFCKMAEQHLTNNRWREVFLLTSGLMVDKGADELLLAMHEAAKRYTRHPKVQALLQWADQVTAGSTGPFKPAAKRAVVITIAINRAIDSTITIAIDRASTLVIAIDRVRAISIAIERATAIARVSAIDRANIIAMARVSAIDRAIPACFKFEQVGIFTNLDLSDLVAKLQVFEQVLNSRDENKILKTAKEVEPAYFKAFQLIKELITWDKEESDVLETYLNSIDLLLKCKQEAARLSSVWDAIEAELFLPPAD